MNTYYVVCITKHPTHQDPHRRIQYVGTREDTADAKATKKWAEDEVIAAIESGRDTFKCTDKRGDVVKVVVATHLGRKYIKTEPDGIKPDNLLAKRECNW